MNGKKTGGRKKGTPNKATAFTRATFATLLDAYATKGDLQKDFESLPPKDRITMAEKLAQYCIPKMQAVAMDIQPETDGTQTLAERLRTLSQEPEN